MRFANAGIRDFLERVVDEDNLLPTAIRAATDCPELKQCWIVFCSKQQSRSLDDGEVADWSDALVRLLSEVEGTPLQCLDLMLGICERTDNRAFFSHLSSATKYLQDVGVQCKEIYNCSALLERLSSSPLSFKAISAAKQATFSKLTKTMIECAGEMYIGELYSIAMVLSECGSDNSVAEKAIRDAFDNFLRNIDKALNEIWDIEQLDGFVVHLDMLMDSFYLSYGDFDKEVERHFEICRRRIDRYALEGYDEYSGGVFLPQEDLSDSQIVSMYEQLRFSGA